MGQPVMGQARVWRFGLVQAVQPPPAKHRARGGFSIDVSLRVRNTKAGARPQSIVPSSHARWALLEGRSIGRAVGRAAPPRAAATREMSVTRV